MRSIDIPKVDVEEQLLDGVIDIHCHAGPCVFEKLFDEAEIAQQMRQVGYRGVLFKQHLLGANRIPLVRKAVPDLEIYGGIALNYFSGGLNPSAVEAAIVFGAKEVKMPNMHAAFHIKTMGAPTYPTISPRTFKMKDEKGITIFGKEGEILPEVLEILGLIADAEIMLSTGHLSPAESLSLIKAATRAGVKKIVVTHANWGGEGFFPPLFPPNGIPVEDQIKMADAGAFIEQSYVPGSVTIKQQERTADNIRKVGASRCVMSTDAGTGKRIHPIEAFRLFIRAMEMQGVSRKEIDTMTKENPAKLLGI
jgi:hypothetical protein